MRWLRLALVLLAGLGAAPGRAGDWLEVRTAHFIVVTQDSEKDARTFASRLERYDQGLRRLFNLPEVDSDRANPVTIYDVRSIDAVGKLCSGLAAQRKACRYVGGFYEGRVSGSVAFIPRPEPSARYDLGATIMFHEYAHHFMLSNFAGAYPAWFVEGFAEFGGSVSFDKPGLVDLGKPPPDRAWMLLEGPKFPIEKLLTLHPGGLDGLSGSAFYARGWLLTHYLTVGATRAGQLDAYLKKIAQGSASLDAAKAVFGDLAKLDGELDKYAGGKLVYIQVKVPELAADAIAVRRLTPGEAAMMPVRLRSKRGVDTALARTVVVDARKRAAPWAHDAGAQLALAEAEYDAGHDDEAEAAADRALAVAPTHRVALEYKGMARMRRLKRAGVTDPKAWQEVRSWFIKANHLEPNDGMALELFYRSFRWQGVPPTKSAIAGLAAALAAVPQDEDLRAMLAWQYLRDGRTAEARKLLVPIAYDPHAPADNAAREMIALIDKDDAAAITAALTRPLPDEADLDEDDAEASTGNAGGEASKGDTKKPGAAEPPKG